MGNAKVSSSSFLRSARSGDRRDGRWALSDGADRRASSSSVGAEARDGVSTRYEGRRVSFRARTAVGRCHTSIRCRRTWIWCRRTSIRCWRSVCWRTSIRCWRTSIRCCRTSIRCWRTSIRCLHSSIRSDRAEARCRVASACCDRDAIGGDVGAMRGARDAWRRRMNTCDSAQTAAPGARNCGDRESGAMDRRREAAFRRSWNEARPTDGAASPWFVTVLSMCGGHVALE